jgi:hypothetical protein
VSIRSRLFHSSWARLIAIALVVSASYPSPAQASDAGAAPAEAQLLADAVKEADFNANIGDGLVQSMPQFCKSQECLHALAGVKAVTARQRVVMKSRGVTRGRLRQTQNLLIASFKRAVDAFVADYPELKERIENPDMSSLSSLSSNDFPSMVAHDYELPTVSLQELSNPTPLHSDGTSQSIFGSVTPLCAAGCSKATCRTQCLELAGIFALICSAYAMCPPCTAICFAVLAYQTAKCYVNCDKCPNP